MKVYKIMVVVSLSLLLLFSVCPPGAAQPTKGDEQDSTERIVVSPQLQSLQEIQAQMRTIMTRLDRADTSSSVQQLQLQVLEEIDEMLAAADDPGQSNPSSDTPSGKAESAAEMSTSAQNQQTSEGEADGGGRRGQDAETPSSRELIEASWGNLPARLQEQVRAALSADFLPKYEKLIEGYYKRLAEADLNGS